VEIIKNITEMQSRADALRQSGKTIGFIPTMGYFHEGHLNLMRMAKNQTDLVIISNYVNPAQFDRKDDLQSYPRDIERDHLLAEKEGVDICFQPDNLYKADHLTWVETEKITDVLCGATRPGHFRGVATIVCKLFNIVKPHIAFLGQKDAQQAAVINRMIKDLNYDIKLVLSPIIRENYSLAMSSRNVRLEPEHRASAPVFYKQLCMIEKNLSPDLSNSGELEEQARKEILKISGTKIDYISILSWPELTEPDKHSKRLLIAGAVFFGNVRLIDNILKEL